MKNRKPMIGVIPLFDDEKDSVWMLPGYLDGIRPVSYTHLAKCRILLDIQPC